METWLSSNDYGVATVHKSYQIRNKMQSLKSIKNIVLSRRKKLPKKNQKGIALFMIELIGLNR